MNIRSTPAAMIQLAVFEDIMVILSKWAGKTSAAEPRVTLLSNLAKLHAEHSRLPAETPDD